MLEDNDYLVPAPESILRKEEDGAFLFDPENGNLKYINEMGDNIYHLCNGNRSVIEIKSLVKQHYRDIPEEQIDGDIDDFLQDLTDMRFLKKKEAE